MMLEIDHVWIMVPPGGMEKVALERAGFKFAPTLNRHIGQGTASITVEFYNAFLELMWRDKSVPVAEGLERAAYKFEQRADWRTSGWSPLGIGLRRTNGDKGELPIPTWGVTPNWLRAGKSIQILTPREDTHSPSLFLSPDYLVVNEAANLKAAQKDPKKAALFEHPAGTQRLTGLKILMPRGYKPVKALQYLQGTGVLDTGLGETWGVEVTFDGWARGMCADLRDELPLVLRW